MTMTRRVAVGGLASVPLLLAGAAGGVFAAAPMTVWRTPGCGCCHKWAGAMATAGLPVALVDVDDLSSVQSRLGVPEALQGCHAGEIGGYVVSGHVPPADVQRLRSLYKGSAGNPNWIAAKKAKKKRPKAAAKKRRK